MFRLDRITAGYGDSLVLRDVTLVVPDASVVALVGANGAGKTTLLRVASGLLRAQSGRLSVDGADLTRASADELVGAGVAHVPEGRGVFPNLTVRENLVLFARDRRAEILERAVEAFPRLGERMGQVAGTMSGGEQQMLALARAYVTDPRVVLLDEVSMGLAPRLVDEIFEFLARLAAEGRALLIVEQYVSKVLAMADYVYVANRGRITFSGEPSELDQAEIFAHYVGAGT
jgi:branched-chain amino acid transport system ATP-binding protein